MTYFGTKVRACPVDDKDTEMLLLKLLLREALKQHQAIGYNARLFAIPDDDSITIVRMAEPDKAIVVSKKRLADAVDRFIDAFVYESDADLANVFVYYSADTTDEAVSWSWMRQATPFLNAVINHKPWLIRPRDGAL